MVSCTLRYIAMCSGGKDSVGSILLAIKNKEPLDTIIFSEVMFDLKNNISGEDPDHIRFVKETLKPYFESFRIEFLILRANRDYLDEFYHIIETPRKDMSHKGKKYGFPVQGQCSIKRDLKLKPIEKYLKNVRKKDSITQYIGIAIDEPKRLVSMHKSPENISLLEKYGYTEEMALNLCKEYNLLSPIYSLKTDLGGDQRRNGCWFCMNAKLWESRKIRKDYPEAWKKFVSLEDEENLAFDKWSVFQGQTLKQRERILKEEESFSDQFFVKTDGQISLMIS